MSKTAKASLQKALARTYWSVDEAMYYLTSPQKNNATLVIKDVSTLNQASEWHRDELYSLWCDTDHSQKPRNEGKSSDQHDDEFKVSYFIQWATSKGFRIAWLKWAIAEKLLPPQIEPQPTVKSESGRDTSLHKLQHKKERSYLLLIAALMNELNIDWSKRPTNSKLRRLVDGIEEQIGEDAVRAVLKYLLADEQIDSILQDLRSKIEPI